MRVSFFLAAALFSATAVSVAAPPVLRVRIGDFAGIRNGPDLSAIQLQTQYYLAENLGLPAMTDWVPGKISPGFASRWEFDGQKELKLWLRNDLKWSDGSPIGREEMAKSFQSLHDKPRNHLPSFKSLFSVERRGPILVLRFSRSVPSVLEELCRADGVLFSGHWSKSSGPYFLESSSGNEMVLSRNRYFPQDLLRGIRPPEKVRIFFRPLAKTADLFRHHQLDLTMNAGLTILPPHQDWVNAGASAYWGALNFIHYLRFARSVPRPVRKAVAGAFLKARENIDVKQSHFQVFDQMIPVGYPSFLTDNNQKRHDLVFTEADRKACDAAQRSDGSAYKVTMWKGYDSIPTKSGRTMSDLVREFLKESRCKALVETLDPGVLDDILRGSHQPEILLGAYSANARSLDGSWSYLASSKQEILTDSKTLHLLDKARHALGDDSKKLELYKQVHVAALKSLDVVPLFAAAGAFFHDKGLDLSQINPLDLRLRFWMMQWRD